MSKVLDVDHRSKWILAALELVYYGLVRIHGESGEKRLRQQRRFNRAEAASR
jgi:hypothetical protein